MGYHFLIIWNNLPASRLDITPGAQVGVTRLGQIAPRSRPYPLIDSLNLLVLLFFFQFAFLLEIMLWFFLLFLVTFISLSIASHSCLSFLVLTIVYLLKGNYITRQA